MAASNTNPRPKKDWLNNVSDETIEKIISEAHRNKLSPNTLRNYANTASTFGKYCSIKGVTVLPAAPASIVGFFAAASTSLKHGTIRQFRAGISHMHVTAGYTDPTSSLEVKDFLRGDRRMRGVALDKKKPLTTEMLREICENYQKMDTALGVCYRFMFLFGFGGGLRISELVVPIFGNIEMFDNGLMYHLPSSKIDQEKKGALIPVPQGLHQVTDPLQAFKDWRDELRTLLGREIRWDDPVFPKIFHQGHPDEERFKYKDGHFSKDYARRIIKTAIRDIGMDPAPFSTHSLRSGMATEANRRGVSRADIMQQGRWKSSAVDGYIWGGQMIKDSASNMLGL